MGDYIGMVSLNEGACIVYAATFNGEEDIYFVRAELPITTAITRSGNVLHISWNSVLRRQLLRASQGVYQHSVVGGVLMSPAWSQRAAWRG
jgi:hypothetical protein